jgi:tetratricopeptide (TPR) repeat protein
MGAIQRQQEKNEEARRSFEAALKIAPDFLLALEQLTDLDLRERRGEQALARAQAFAGRHPEAATPWLLLGRVQLALGALKPAEEALQKAAQLDSASPAASMLLAQLYIRTNQRGPALERLEAVLARKTNDTGALLLTGQVRNDNKEYGKAREAYEKLLKLEPKSVPALNNLAYLCVENLKDVDAGYRYAQQAYLLAPKDASVTDTLGWALCHRKEYASALTYLREAAAQRPSDPDVQFHLGTAHYMMAQEEPARAAFQKALAAKSEFASKARAEERLWVLGVDPQRPEPGAVARLEQIVTGEPNDLQALLRLAAVAERNGPVEKAAGLYRRALDANPKSTTVALELARFYSERQRDPAKALEQAKAAVELAPNDPQVALRAGQIACRAGDYKRAYSLLRGSAAEAQADPEVLYDLAVATYHQGRVTDGLATMRRALAAPDPFPRREAAQRFVQMVELVQTLPDPERNEAQVQEVLKKEPKDVPALMGLGLLRERRGEFDQARRIYEEQILKTSPDFAPASRRLAFLYADQLHDDFKALSAGNKAREVFDQDPALLKLLGKVAYRRKDYAQAVQLLSQSSVGLPQDADVFFQLGLAYHQLNSKEQSKSALEKALGLNLEAQSAQEAQRILASLK